MSATTSSPRTARRMGGDHAAATPRATSGSRARRTGVEPLPGAARRGWDAVRRAAAAQGQGRRDPGAPGAPPRVQATDSSIGYELRRRPRRARTPGAPRRRRARPRWRQESQGASAQAEAETQSSCSEGGRRGCSVLPPGPAGAEEARPGCGVGPSRAPRPAVGGTSAPAPGVPASSHAIARPGRGSRPGSRACSGDGAGCASRPAARAPRRPAARRSPGASPAWPRRSPRRAGPTWLT